MEGKPICLFLIVCTGLVTGQHFPEGLHLSYGDDPSIMQITWSTRKDPGDCVVLYGLIEKDGEGILRTAKEAEEPDQKGEKEPGEGQEKQLQPPPAEGTVRATTSVLVPGIFPNTKQYIHKAALPSLLPGKEYWYKCGSPSQESWSAVKKFRTMPSGTKWSPRLAIYGDLGAYNHKILRRLVEDVQGDSLDAVLHSGDIAYDLNSDEGRTGDLFLQEIEPVASRIPYMVAPGNHEAFRNFVNYKSRFFMPGIYENMMYSFRMGPLLVIAISTEAYYTLENGDLDAVCRQESWLTSVLKNANQNRGEVPWIIVFGHRPMYCSSKLLNACSSSKVRDGAVSFGGRGLEKVLYDHGVDLVFWGHQHNYERMFPVYKKKVYNGTNDDPYDNPRAPIHIIAGRPGNSEPFHKFVSSPPEWSAYRSADFGYVRLNVENKTHLQLQYVPDVITDPVVDEIWIKRDTHGPNQFLFPQNNYKTEEELPMIYQEEEEEEVRDQGETKDRMKH